MRGLFLEGWGIGLDNVRVGLLIIYCFVWESVFRSVSWEGFPMVFTGKVSPGFSPGKVSPFYFPGKVSHQKKPGKGPLNLGRDPVPKPDPLI